MQRVSIVERDLERVSRLKAILREIVQPSQPSGTAQVRSMVGQQQVATAGEGSTMKPHIFVAMPFAKEFQDVYIFGIQGPINNAGVGKTFSFLSASANACLEAFHLSAALGLSTNAQN